MYCNRHDQLIPTPSSPPLLPQPPPPLDEKLCVYVYFVVYNLVRPKTTTVPDDSWSMCES
jgi:hypothetical protein